MKDTTKLFIACCTFSFVTGIFIAVILNLGREINLTKQCTVTYSHGKETHVLVGSR